LNDRFEKGYRHLLQFQEEFGHTRPSDDYETPEGFLLGGWIRSQRTYRRKETLPKEHQAKLDALGPEWF